MHLFFWKSLATNLYYSTSKCGNKILLHIIVLSSVEGSRIRDILWLKESHPYGALTNIKSSAIFAPFSYNYQQLLRPLLAC